MAKPMKKIWKIKENKPIDFSSNMPGLITQIAVNRGFDTVKKFNDFFINSTANMHDPFLMKDMEKAVKRILQAKNQGEKVLIYGDYDVDGVTSTVIISKLLSFLNISHIYYHPHRQNDGYGFHLAGVELAKTEECSLIITVDVGISAIGTVAAANHARIDVIITDHHKVSGPIPNAVAVIDPQQTDCNYPYKNLAGAGVALKIVDAYMRYTSTVPGNKCDDFLVIAALGTVVDVAPLTGENRIITKLGLDAMNQNPSPGIKALCEVAGIDKKINAGHLGFQLGPRLNAVGRLEMAKEATELLLSNDPEICKRAAQSLDATNKHRKEIQKKISEEALNQAKYMDGTVLVVSGEGWHRGIIGLAASYLQEQFYKPTIVISTCNGKGHGSCRSIPGFDIFSALQKHGQFFLGYGGHKQAAGLSIKTVDIPYFAKKINEYARDILSTEDLTPKLNIDLAIPDLNELTIETIEEFEMLQPFGYGNPGPVITIKNCHLQSAPQIIGKDHLKFRVNDSKGNITTCIGWGMAGRIAELGEYGLNIAFKPTINEWNLNKTVQLIIQDFKSYR